MCYAPESCDVGEYGYENHTAGKPPYICHATSEHGCDSCHYNSFGALHQSNLALDVQSLGSDLFHPKPTNQKGGKPMFHKVIITLLKPLSFLPALLVMYMIFSFSAQNGTESGDLSFKVSVKLVEVGSEVLDMKLTDSEIQMYANKYHHYVRKLGHMTEYCVLAITLCVPLYAYGVRGIWLYLLAGLICAGFATTDEYHQSFVAGRGPSVRDVCIDTFGAMIGITGTQIVGWAAVKSTKELERERKRKRKQKRRRQKR